MDFNIGLMWYGLVWSSVPWVDDCPIEWKAKRGQLHRFPQYQHISLKTILWINNNTVFSDPKKSATSLLVSRPTSGHFGIVIPNRTIIHLVMSRREVPIVYAFPMKLGWVRFEGNYNGMGWYGSKYGYVWTCYKYAPKMALKDFWHDDE